VDTPTTFAIDFETYYDKDYSVKTLGPVAYVNDSRFDAYLVSIVGDNGFEWVGHPSQAPWPVISGHRWVSHNASFDQPVFLRLVALGIVPNDVSPCEWLCTADLCAYLQKPRSLKDACSVLFGVKLNKAVRSRLSGKRHSGELFPDKSLLEYALDDSRYCLRLWTSLELQWPAHERELSHLTRWWGVAGVFVDLARLAADMATLARLRAEAQQQIPWVRDDADVVLSKRHLALNCREAGIEPPKSLAMDDEDCAIWEDTYGEQFPWVAAMRQWRRTNMLLAKYEAIQRRTLGKGCMSYNLKYCGAQHTGRWSGDAGVNLQNLPRGDMFGVNLRACFIPAPGCVFVVVDFSQIEPRVLAWLTEDSRLLGHIHACSDFYEAQARSMGLWDKSEPLRSDPALRHKIKGLNLGLAYGMGWKRFQLLTSLDTAECKRLVALYQEKNKPVLAMWDELERKARKASQRKNTPVLQLELPSGRVIQYFDVQTKKGLTAQFVQGSKERKYITGPLLTENVTQAVAREVFAAALLRVQTITDCRVVWHVHDEIICEVPKNLAAGKQAEIERVMCVPPEWASDLPIAVESSIEERYTK